MRSRPLVPHHESPVTTQTLPCPAPVCPPEARARHWAGAERNKEKKDAIGSAGPDGEAPAVVGSPLGNALQGLMVAHPISVGSEGVVAKPGTAIRFPGTLQLQTLSAGGRITTQGPPELARRDIAQGGPGSPFLMIPSLTGPIAGATTWCTWKPAQPTCCLGL